MTDKSVLTAVKRRFILHWGEMGSRWGINRTVAQVHALLHISEQPVSAETIAAALGVARSNVSTSLRELQGWGIVRAVHVLGDRRVHFTSVSNVWELFRIIVDQRKRREIDPTVDMLRRALDELEGSKPGDRFTRGAAAGVARVLRNDDGVVRRTSTSSSQRAAVGCTHARTGPKTVDLGNRRRAMSPVALFLVGVAVTAALAIAVVWYLKPYLHDVLVDLCGTAPRAAFWTAFSNVTVALTPILFALHYRPRYRARTRTRCSRLDRSWSGRSGACYSR